MNKEILQEYLTLQKEKERIEERQTEIKDDILVEMLDSQLDKIESDFGSFTVTRRKTWKYSSKVDELKNLVDDRKEQEEKDGTATFTEKPGLIFTSLKEKK